MRQFAAIAINAFMELVRQPVFLLLTTASAAFEIFLATPYYFAFGDEPKLVKNSVLAVMLLSGLFGAVLSASAALAREIRGGTALAVLSKRDLHRRRRHRLHVRRVQQFLSAAPLCE
jgi:hypothetical protein